MNRYAVPLLLIALAGPSGIARAEKFSAPDYDAHVTPILKKFCVGCHNGKEAKGDLDLERIANLKKGGKRGPALVAGKSGESLLIATLRGTKKPSMPPKGKPRPSDADIALLAAWIDAGALGADKPGPKPLVTPKIETVGVVTKGINSLRFSPDGKLVAIAQADAVLLVDASSRVIRRRLGPHVGAVTSVRFSRDGAKLVSAAGEPGLQGQAKLWNVVDGKLLRAFVGHQDSLYAAELNSDAGILATAGYDKEIILWDTDSGEKLATLTGHNDAVYGLAFSPDDRFLASASGDNTVKLWDVFEGARLDTFVQPTKEVYTVVFSPDGKRLAAGGVDHRIRVWEVGSEGKEGTNPILYSRFAHDGPIIRLAYSADGKLLASSAEDRTVKVWSADLLKERFLLEPQSDWAQSLTFAPDAKSLLVGRHDGTMALYYAATGEKSKDFKAVPPKPELLALAPRGFERGKPTKVRLTGKNLKDATALKPSNPALAVAILPPPEGVDAATELWAELKPGADLPRGTYSIAVVTVGGESGPLKLFVDDLVQIEETEPNDALAQTKPKPTPADWWGAIDRKGDVDHFSLEAKMGQSLVFDVAAASLGSKLNAALTLLDSSGRVVAGANRFDDQNDPLLSYRVPADGRYIVRIGDVGFDGSTNHFYRLSVGELPVVTAVFPLSVPPDAEHAVELVGLNLPADAKVNVKSGASGDVAVPIDANRFRSRKQFKILVGAQAEIAEAEPNDAPNQATALTAPATAHGRIRRIGELAGKPDSPPDVDLFRFEAKKGESWIVETDAAGRGSPVDTRIEILDADGKPIDRLLLQATRDSYVHFRGIDSSGLDCRVKNWEEMELNQYMYLGGEVCKLFRMPLGPDSGFQFYGVGKRFGYFDTSATAHALEDPCYIVQPHPPGSKLTSNGLPVFRLRYENDDSADRKLGSDSRLTFTAPADGSYLVRVSDVRQRGGDRFAYRLIVRKPKPDFTVRIAGANPTVYAGSGRELTLSCDRLDGFDGEVRFDITGLPPGFTVASPIVIEAGHYSAKTVLSAAPDAPAPTKENWATTKVTATATIAGATVTKPAGDLGTVKLAAEKPTLTVRLDPPEITIAPGGSATVRLIAERNGYDERIQFDVDNLLHGVIVDNIGLNRILIPKGQSERTLYLTARKWVPDTSRPFHAIGRSTGRDKLGKHAADQASLPVMLHVRAPKALAEAAPQE